MITLIEVEELHDKLISDFGGSSGIRDKGSLESALARPFQTFDGNELYPTALQKAASILESILINHPFVDGNKRTGYVLMRLFLLQNNLDLYATEDEKYSLVSGVAAGDIDFEEILHWLEVHHQEFGGA